MTYRCINAFIFADQVFPGGMKVDDDHPILKTHAANFARVDEPPVAVETASASPGVPRFIPTQKPAPTASMQGLPKKRGRPKKQDDSPSLPAPVEPEGNENA